MLIPLVSKKTFWSTGDPHTPLADAIKVGNMEMVKAIIPYTKVDTTSKKFGSYLHVAVKYSRLEIFKYLCQLVENWKSLKDRKGRTADQLLLKDDFQFVAYEDYKKKARPTWECDSSDEDELNQGNSWLNPNWHDGGHSPLLFFFCIRFCQLSFYQTFPKLSGGGN